MRIPLAATLLLCCAALGVVEAKSADRRSAPLPGLDQGITVPTHIRDAVPSDCPNLLYCKSCDEEHFLEGWTGTYTVYKNTKGEFRGFDIEQATSPALDFSGAVRPVMCIENISGTFSISTDGNNFVKCLSRGKYIEIPPTTKYIRITNGRLNSLLFIIDAAKEGPEYPTDLGKIISLPTILMVKYMTIHISIRIRNVRKYTSMLLIRKFSAMGPHASVIAAMIFL